MTARLPAPHRQPLRLRPDSPSGTVSKRPVHARPAILHSHPTGARHRSRTRRSRTPPGGPAGTAAPGGISSSRGPRAPARSPSPSTLTGTPVTAIVANPTGYDDAVFPIEHYPAQGETIPVSLTSSPALQPVPPSAEPPTDPDGDGLHDDVNGNDCADVADVVLYFNQMTWIAANEPVAAFHFKATGRDRVLQEDLRDLPAPPHEGRLSRHRHRARHRQADHRPARRDGPRRVDAGRGLDVLLHPAGRVSLSWIGSERSAFHHCRGSTGPLLYTIISLRPD